MSNLIRTKSPYQEIWDKAEPLLKQKGKKDYWLHARMVARAMNEIIAGEGGNPDILVPAAILHDIGWSNVPLELALSGNREAEVQHIKQAPAIIKRILTELEYDNERIERIIDIVVAHKFVEPKEKEKQMLIDADALSDTYKESFYSDVDSYNSTPRKTWEFRSKNTFYTQTAKKIFKKELSERLSEIEEKAQKT